MTSRGPVLRWMVGCGAELRERLLWRGELEDTFITGVDCTRLPDGTPVVVCGTGDDRWFEVWDLAAGTSLGRPGYDLPGRRMRDPRSVVCTDLPDGTPVAVTLGQDGALRVWDLVAGRMRAATDSDAVHAQELACTLLPDGTVIAVTGGTDGAVRFWDVATAQPYGRPVTCETPRPKVACPAPVDGASLLVIADGARLKVWDLPGGGFRGEPIETGIFSVWSLNCLRLADGTLLAVVGSGREWNEATGRHGVVRAWDVATGRPYGPPLTDHGGEIIALACTQLPDGTPIAVSVDRYGSTRPLNLRSGLAHGPSLPHVGDWPEVACTRLPDGTPVVVVADEDIRMWSLDVRPFPQGLTGPIWTLGRAGLPDGDDVLVTAGREAVVG